jgi:hypothetical protein
MPRKNKRRSKKQNKQNNPKNQLYRQLHENDLYVIDLAVAVNETTDIGYDLYTAITASTDYTNLLITYGEIAYQSVTFSYNPFFSGSVLVTDYANGVFGTRQGVYDVGVTAKTIASLIRTPGSLLINNKQAWSRFYPIVHNGFFSSSETNTAVSDVPKFNYYFCWFNNASTNTSKGLLYIKMVVRARCKID